MEDSEDISIVIEQYDGFIDGDLYVQNEYLYINGTQVETNGNHILAILQYLGYNAVVEYH